MNILKLNIWSACILCLVLVATVQNTYSQTHGVSEILLKSEERFNTDSNIVLTSNDPECFFLSSSQDTKFCKTMSDELPREFYIYDPRNSENNDLLPLMIVLHGGGDYALNFMEYSGFKEQAYKHKFLLIFPQGAQYKDKLSTGWNTENDGIDDVTFIENLINWAYQNERIKRNEVYISGFSNGGFMAYHLACNLNISIAGIASVAGLMGNHTFNSCAPTYSIPIIHIHGKEDNIILIEGSNYYVPLEDVGERAGVISFWRSRNKCSEHRRKKLNNKINGIVSIDKWTGCAKNVEMEYYIFQDYGHKWSSFKGGLDTSQIIWDFLKRFDFGGLKTGF